MTASRAIRWGSRGVAAAVLLAAGFAVLRLVLLDGWLRTVRIDGASMAPTLCGTHLLVTCSDCGIRFRCDAEHLSDDGRLVCPNCGYGELDAGAFPVQAGDKVLIDRWPLWRQRPRRWDVVAYDDPLSGGAAVKRVAGLPGEQVAIRGGDLYASGRIVRKSLAELRELAVLVHDNDHLPRSLDRDGFVRWKPALAASAWQATARGFRYGQPAPAAAARDWLAYVHWRCDASGAPRDEPAPIFDNDAYNQGQTRRLNRVIDLLLSCDVQFSASGELILAIFARGQWLEVQIDAASGAIAVTRDGRRLTGGRHPHKLAGRRAKLEFGHCDGRLLLAIDAHEPLALRLDAEGPSALVEATPISPLRVAYKGGSCELAHLCVWRDTYLLEPRGTDRPWTMSARLSENGFLLLGDNPTVSIDGRHFSSGLDRRRLRGIVYPLAGAASAANRP